MASEEQSTYSPVALLPNVLILEHCAFGEGDNYGPHWVHRGRQCELYKPTKITCDRQEITEMDTYHGIGIPIPQLGDVSDQKDILLF